MAVRAAASIMLVVVVALLAGCTAPARVADPPPVPSPSRTTRTPSPPYTGPLHLTTDQIRSETDRRTGAAGRVVSCRTTVVGHRDDPDVGHEGAATRSPQRALDVGFSEGFFDTSIESFELERKEADRVLFTHRVDGTIRQAVIVHRGEVRDRDRTVGWYVESRARCDWAELPDDLPGWLGTRPQVWTGADGLRAPTYDVVSFPGAEHCDWQSMTMLSLGSMDDLVFYVRVPLAELGDYFAEPYRADVPVPADAIDTGYSREGRHLWLAADRRRAYVGSPEHAELWPITTQQLGCVGPLQPPTCQSLSSLERAEALTSRRFRRR